MSTHYEIMSRHNTSEDNTRIQVKYEKEMHHWILFGTKGVTEFLEFWKNSKKIAFHSFGEEITEFPGKW